MTGVVELRSASGQLCEPKDGWSKTEKFVYVVLFGGVAFRRIVRRLLTQIVLATVWGVTRDENIFLVLVDWTFFFWSSPSGVIGGSMRASSSRMARR
jgi:hypothetical protein